jgi:RNA polymerase sigma-54 factor
MKHSLQIRLSQHLTLTPQLQQSIRLLQLSTLELNQEIEKYLQDNPLLERDDDTRDETTAPPVPGGAESMTAEAPPGNGESAPAESSGSSTESGDGAPFEQETSYAGARDDNDEAEYPQLAAETPTLREYLISQLSLLNLSDRDQTLVTLLIDSLDDDGYLQQDLAELAGMLPPELEIDIEELQVAVKHLQNLDPPGVGARGLGECLMLQLEVLPESTPFRAQALDVVKHHLDALAARDFIKLKKLLHCDDETLRGIKNLITGLNPRPGGAYS